MNTDTVFLPVQGAEAQASGVPWGVQEHEAGL